MSTHGHNVDLVSLYEVCTDIVVSYLHMNLLAYVTFEWHIWCWHMSGNSIFIKSCILKLVCAVVWGVYVNYSSSTVCAM